MTKAHHGPCLYVEIIRHSPARINSYKRVVLSLHFDFLFAQFGCQFFLDFLGEDGAEGDAAGAIEVDPEVFTY